MLWLQIYFTLEVYCVCVSSGVMWEMWTDKDEFANKMKLVLLVLLWKWSFSVTSISYCSTPTAKNIRRSLTKKIMIAPVFKYKISISINFYNIIFVHFFLLTTEKISNTQKVNSREECLKLGDLLYWTALSLVLTNDCPFYCIFPK